MSKIEEIDLLPLEEGWQDVKPEYGLVQRKLRSESRGATEIVSEHPQPNTGDLDGRPMRLVLRYNIIPAPLFFKTNIGKNEQF